MGKSTPNPTDRHVGSRIRMRRLMLHMSQTTLGNELGLTFQQVQKYEKGTNRVGASRLQNISQILQVPVTFFFEGAAPVDGQLTEQPSDDSLDYVTDFVASSDGLNLIGAFVRIDNAKLRRHIVHMVEAIADRSDG
jgi:transcriptional regulator with XRE-family HTH domain